jgi:hypothetical protein
MPRARKINLEKVQASLDAVCREMRRLDFAQVRRIDFERIECPVCGEQFVPSPRSESGPVQAQKRPNLFCRHVGPFLN